MVNSEGGQLYTIEGIAAGLLMIMTAYLVVNATSVYTAGDTHISDMQLEQLGSDALKMMDTPENSTVPQSELQGIINSSTPNGAAFNTTFLNLVRGQAGSGGDRIQYTANYTCRIDPDVTEPHLISYSRNMTVGEHAVRVTKWVLVKPTVPFCGTTGKTRAVLVEVLLWRD
jgi:hypothetical protein